MTYPASPQVDLHVHTVASGHAFSTLAEIVTEASRKGLRGFGMTDHGPNLPGGPHSHHFAALRFIPEYLNDIRVFKGIEANILDGGNIDLAEGLCQRLDLILAGFHEDCGFTGEGRPACTEAVLQAMENPRIKVITHPGNPRFPLDYETVVRRAAATGTALELNNASFFISRKGSADNCREIARLCARFGAPVAIGSDAHLALRVGLFDHALAAALEAGIAWEQVVNRTLESTFAFLDLPAQ